MHELSITTSLYTACRREVDARGGGVISQVQIAVGELSAVEPDLLQFAWEAVTAGTADRGAALKVDWRWAEQRCPECGVVAERQLGSWLRLCPNCSAPLTLTGGHELDILDIEYEVELQPSVQEEVPA